MKKIKKLKKILIVLSITIMMLALNFLGLVNSVYAAELINSAKLNDDGDCGALLKYNGTQVVTTYVSYNDGKNTYPAYCLNVNLPGVGENGSYTVSTDKYVTDIGLWRVIINGYPYKTASELGCKNKKEAFTATKHAVYCYIHGINPNNYSAIGTAGERTLKAMKKIVKDAKNSTETKMTPTITINKYATNWKEDDKDKNYISKTYEVDANSNYKTYKISIKKSGNEELPEGTKVTNIENKEQAKFNKGEKFKVLIPIKSLDYRGEFTLNIASELNTKPVLYGKAPNEKLQDYAITTLKYEDGKSSIKDSYEKNTTNIKIYKKEKNTEKPLEGVIFDLLNSNKQIEKAELKTDAEGKIKLDGIMPGKYYLREIKTLSGYVKYDEDIEINVELGEEFKVTVYNSKETKIEVEKAQKEVTVGKEAQKTEIKETVEKLAIQKETIEEERENSQIENIEINTNIKENIENNKEENVEINENLEKNKIENTQIKENLEKNTIEDVQINESIENNRTENKIIKTNAEIQNMESKKIIQKEEKAEIKNKEETKTIFQNNTTKKLPITGM